MKKIALYLVHPSLEENSVINKTLLKNISDLENVTIIDLYKKYPDFKINVEEEQKTLLEHDVVVFQFPFYWFSSPALLKEWFDVVLTPDFAYGDNCKLENKDFAVITTAAGSEETYIQSGTLIKEFLKPMQSTAAYISMNYKEPFIVHNTYVLNEENLNDITNEYIQYLKNLSK